LADFFQKNKEHDVKRLNMIPKIIHYCWFGRGVMPALARDCIKTWKDNLPDYKIVKWDEDNFDIHSHPYVYQAYKNRKYAFVSDYARIFALYNTGGIYMDTDVEVIKNLDCFLSLPAFSGFESDEQIPTGIIGSEKGGEWVESLLKLYENKTFIREDNTLDLTPNTVLITKDMVNNGFQMNNRIQNYKDQIVIFPKDYFCPKSLQTGKINKTENSFTIHHFAGSWIPKYKKVERAFWKSLQMKDYQILDRIKNKWILFTNYK
jgi:hypothetical protein